MANSIYFETSNLNGTVVFVSQKVFVSLRLQHPRPLRDLYLVKYCLIVGA